MKSKHQSARESYVSVAKSERSLFVSYNRTGQVRTYDTHQEKRNGSGTESGMNAAETIPDTIQCLRQQSRDSYYQQKAKRYKQTCRQTEGYLSTRFGPVIHISAVPGYTQDQGNRKGAHQDPALFLFGPCGRNVRSPHIFGNDPISPRYGRNTRSPLFSGTGCLPMKMRERLTCRARA